MCTHTDVNKNNKRYYEIEHADHKSKWGRPVKTVFYFWYIISLCVHQTCQNIARTNKKSGILLRQCLALFFLVAANTTSFNLSKFDTTDLKAQNKYIGAIS